MIVFFDLDGTLLDHASALRSAALRFRDHFRDFHDTDADVFLKIWTLAHDRNVERYRRGELDFQDQRRERMRQVFSFDLTDDDADRRFDVYLQAYTAEWRLFPDALPCLTNLHEHTLALITNGDSSQQRQKLDSTGISHFFANVLVAGDIGISKPDPRIFAHACSEFDVPPHATVYVGDQLNVDVLPANRFGMRAVWLDRSNLRTPPDGVLRIPTLADLPSLLAPPPHWHRQRGGAL